MVFKFSIFTLFLHAHVHEGITAIRKFGGVWLGSIGFFKDDKAQAQAQTQTTAQTTPQTAAQSQSQSQTQTQTSTPERANTRHNTEGDCIQALSFAVEVYYPTVLS